MDELNLIQKISVFALPVIFAITGHEAAHAYAARHFGDNTAYLEGRMTLNPLRHIDWIGTVLLPLVCVAVGGFIFGWAKPVPVRFGNLRHPKRDMLWVAVAGPAINLVMALGWALLLKFDTLIPFNDYSRPLALMCEVGIGINIALMMLNLIPLPPLDGGRIAVSLLPWSLAMRFARLERWGFFILLALMYFNVLDVTVWPLVSLLKQFIINLFF